MATFGKTTVGGSSVGQGLDRPHGTKYTSPSDANGATVTKLTAYIKGFSSTINVKGLIYTSAGTLVGNAISTPTSVTTTEGWYDFNFTNPVIIQANTVYLLWIVCDGNESIYYDVGVLGDYMVDTTNSYASPTDVTDMIGANTYNMSIYATYTPVTMPVGWLKG